MISALYHCIWAWLVEQWQLMVTVGIQRNLWRSSTYCNVQRIIFANISILCCSQLCNWHKHKDAQGKAEPILLWQYRKDSLEHSNKAHLSNKVDLLKSRRPTVIRESVRRINEGRKWKSFLSPSHRGGWNGSAGKGICCHIWHSWLWCLEYTQWKEKTGSCKLSSHINSHLGACMSIYLLLLTEMKTIGKCIIYLLVVHLDCVRSSRWLWYPASPFPNLHMLVEANQSALSYSCNDHCEQCV